MKETKMENEVVDEVMYEVMDEVKTTSGKVTTGTKNGEIMADNRGIGVVEIILILVVIIGLVLIFKEQISDIVTSALATVSKNAGEISN